MAQRKKRYRLYAMGRTRKTEEIAYDTRFYRICAGYILLYLTGRKKPEVRRKAALRLFFIFRPLL